MNNTHTYYQFLFTVLLAIGIGSSVFAQQIPVFNQYLYNPEFYNPAAMGESFIAIQYRNQFSDLENRYAPKSYAIHADLSSILGLSEKKIGLGMSLLSDKAHIINRIKGKLYFAYHLIKNRNSDLSAGIEAGLFSQRMDFKDTRISNPQDIVIYDGAIKQSTFDGGFGLRYRYMADSGQEFNFNLAVPQLFTSDLTYEEGQEFVISPHLLSGISYKIPIGSAAIEPLVMYRDILGEKSLKEGKMDIGLRAHFLDNHIWLGAGMRLGTAAYNFNIGLQLVDNFHFLGSFETHNVLGNNWEIGLVYRFDSTKPEANDFDPSETESLSITFQMELLETQAEKSKIEVVKLLDQASGKAKEVESAIQTAQKRGVDRITIQSEIQKADLALVSMKSIVERAIDPALKVNNSLTEGAIYYEKAIDENATNKKIDRSWDIIQKLESQTSRKVNNLIHSYSQLYKEISVLKPSQKTKAEQLTTLISNKDVGKLQSYFQQELFTALGITENTLPVVVTTDGRVIRLKYEYAHSKADFKLERALSEPRFMADFISEQIKALQVDNIKINNLVITTQLQSRKSALEETTLNTKYNEYQFGPSVNINYRFFDELEKTIQSLKETILPGKINLLELTCLKMYGLKRYFERNGASISRIPIELELRAPNYEQFHPEIYSITIEFK